MGNGGLYHKKCADEAYEYERGKLHARQDLETSQQHCRDLQRQLDEAKRENAKLRLELARSRV
jgi:predicted RNase H-like nuclease (RuvC/YqgF family)